MSHIAGALTRGPCPRPPGTAPSYWRDRPARMRGSALEQPREQCLPCSRRGCGDEVSRRCARRPGRAWRRSPSHPGRRRRGQPVRASRLRVPRARAVRRFRDAVAAWRPTHSSLSPAPSQPVRTRASHSPAAPCTCSRPGSTTGPGSGSRSPTAPRTCSRHGSTTGPASASRSRTVGAGRRRQHGAGDLRARSRHAPAWQRGPERSRSGAPRPRCSCRTCAAAPPRSRGRVARQCAPADLPSPARTPRIQAARAPR